MSTKDNDDGELGMPSIVPAEPSHSFDAACFSWHCLRALYSANVILLGCWLTLASSTLLPAGCADAVGCSAVDEGDVIGGFECCRAVISGTEGHVAPNEA